MRSSTSSKTSSPRVRQSHIADERARRIAERCTAFPNDPVGYARNVLKVIPWEVQEEAARALLQPPYRVLVKSGHSVGKSFLAAWLINWWFDSFVPSAVISTAPSHRDVCDVLWKEVRIQRARTGIPSHFIGPSAPEMRTSPGHYAKGFTATKGESFQGRHDARMLFVFDEAVGVDPLYWETVQTMFKPEEGHAWLAICNPTDTTSAAYLEDCKTDEYGNPKWRSFTLSALDHPNVTAELARQRAPIPGAVTLAQVNQWVAEWCEPVHRDDVRPTDLQWPPGSGRWYRPGPVFEARVLGRWPSAGLYGVWSDYLWGTIEKQILPIPHGALPQIGCDVAYKGDDFTANHVRWGDTSVHHETANGWEITQTAGRLKDLAREWARKAGEHFGNGRIVDPREILIKVDDDGVGGGVVSILREGGFNVVPVGAGSSAMEEMKYPNKRSELWFQTAERARMGKLSLARLDRMTLARLKQQAMAPEWKMDSAGRRVVEPKDDTKEKIGRSPDDMDALNLAYYDAVVFEAPPTIFTAKKRIEERMGEPENAAGNGKRRLFGR